MFRIFKKPEYVYIIKCPVCKTETKNGQPNVMKCPKCGNMMQVVSKVKK